MLDCEFIEAPERGSARLLITLHGLGDSMDGYRWLPEMLNLPALNHLLVNAPDPYYGGYSWYDFAGDPGPGIRRSRQELFELLREWSKKFAPEQVYLFGFSQGCLMTLDVGLRYPHRLAGLIGVSGYVFEPDQIARELSPVARSQRILLTHGTLDTMIPIERVRPQIDLLKAAGLRIAWHEFAKNHTIAGEQELSVIRDFIEERDRPRN